MKALKVQYLIIQMSFFVMIFVNCNKENDVIENISFTIPEVKTISILQVGRLIKVRGSALSDNRSPIVEKGICYDTTGLPTVENAKNFNDTDFNITDKYFQGYFTIKLKELKPGTTYFVRAYASTKDGTAYGETLKLTTQSLSQLVIGDYYGGGQLAYFLQPGDPGYINGELHGIIIAQNDLPDPHIWGGSNKDFIGAGKLNTEIHSFPVGTKSNAASVCNDLILNGYNDWYLPCAEEFSLVLRSMQVLDNFKEGAYWSSTWTPHTNPFADPVYPKRFHLHLKVSYFSVFDWSPDGSGKCYVRPIRYF